MEDDDPGDLLEGLVDPAVIVGAVAELVEDGVVPPRPLRQSAQGVDGETPGEGGDHPVRVLGEQLEIQVLR